MMRIARFALLALLALLFGCDETADQRTTLDFWAFGREGEAVQELTAAFEREHPHIRVRVQQIPWSAAHEKLLTAFAGGSMPDLFQLGNTWLPEFVVLGALTDLRPWTRTDPDMEGGAFFEGAAATNVIDGAVYGVPWYVDTRLVFYRTDILERAGYTTFPETWSGWREAMRRVKETAGAGRYAIFLPIDDWTLPTILAMQLGAPLLDPGARFGAFDEPRFRAALRFYLDMFGDGLAPSAGGTHVANLYQEFANGDFAMFVSGPWNIGELRRRVPGLADAWATAPMPGPDDGTPGVSLAGGASLVIHAGSAHKDAAWTLVRYLSGTERQVRFRDLTGNLPARRDAWQASGLADDRTARAFWRQLRHLAAAPRIPEWERIARTLGRHAETAIRGEMTLDEAVTALDADVDRLLEKRRWLLSRRQ